MDTAPLDMSSLTPTNWVSDHEFLHSRAAPSSRWLLWKHDLQRKSDVFLRGLSAALQRSRAYSGWLQVSPDGEWVMCANPVGVTICSLTGSVASEQRVGWNSDRTLGNPFGWMADSRHWAELVQGDAGAITRVLIRSIDKRTNRVVDLTSPVEFPAMLGGDYGLVVTPKAQLLYIAAKTRIVNGEFANSTGTRSVLDSADRVRIDLSGAHATPQRTNLVLPSDLFVGTAYVSPVGNRILWLAYEKLKSSDAAQALWISDITGHNWKEIINVPRSAQNGWEGIQDVHWLPGGATVSYSRSGHVYLVSL